MKKFISRKEIKKAMLAVALPLFVYAVDAVAGEECPDWDADSLTGDWGGLRKNLCSKGVKVEATHKSDVMSNLSGGIKQGSAWMGHTELRVAMDMEKWLGWQGTSAYFHYHSQLGDKFNRDYVGSFVGVDNIESSVNTAQVSQAWLSKLFLGDSVSVLGGLYAIDSEFYVTETSGLFMQPPYGMANDLAQTGLNGPPIFPVSALAVRVKYTSHDGDVYVQGAVMDGVPGDPANPYGTHIKLDSTDGTLAIAEFGYTPKERAVPAAQSAGAVGEYFNKTAIGLWQYSSQFDDRSDVDSAGNPLRRPSYGYYLLAERTLFVEQSDPSQGLSGFIRYGTANADLQQADWTASAGLRYHGLITGRDNDLAGIAVTYNHASAKYQLANDATSAQTNVEASYRARINSWLGVQPTLQYIMNPNMNKTLNDVWIAGIRAEISI